MSKITVGMVQINNSFANQDYIPYSLGILQAYAQKYLPCPEQFEFLPPIYARLPVRLAVDQLLSADIVCFSVYVWNMRISCAIAGQLKQFKPGMIVIFGGPHVPNRDMNFLREHPFIDLTIHGEGEIPFLKALEFAGDRAWAQVPSVRFMNSRGEVVQTAKAERIKDLDTIPSPYLSGVFDQLIKVNPAQEWLALWETNRGCPFSCAFCDWGSATQSKVHKFDLERLFLEVDWFSRNRIKFILCCDANFGILPRDIDIARYVARKKEATGYPQVLSVQNTKNSTESSYQIQKILGQADLKKGVTLAVQSMSPQALERIKRRNIKLSVYQELQKRFAQDKVETYTDFILGLPGETYDSFKDGVSQLIDHGQHHRIQFNNLSVLPNAEINDPLYRLCHGIQTVNSRMINMHGSLNETDGIYEVQELVTATNTMCQEDLRKVRAFAWMTSLLHFDKVLQIPLILVRQLCGVSYRELFELFFEGDIGRPVIQEIRRFFMEKARDIQNGGEEYCASEDWLNIWWPADELVLIKLCAGGKLQAFYEEAQAVLTGFLQERNLAFPPGLLEQAIYLNHQLMKQPFGHADTRRVLRYNIFEYYRGIIVADPVPLQEGEFCHAIDRGGESWSSWKDWCRQVVWYGNKRGAYLYSCHAQATAALC